MGKFLGRITVTVTLAGTLAVATAGTAYGAGNSSSSPASTSSPSTTLPGLAAIKAEAAAKISLRLSWLDAAIPAVQGNTWISSTDKTTLLATLNSDVSGLTALGSTIQGDTTAAQAEADYQTIFTDYRVFRLLLPQVRFAAACDDVTDGVLPRLGDAQTKLQSLLSGVDSSKDTPAVQAAMADLANQISSVTTATSGLSATVLAYTPADFDANPGILSGPESTLLSARADVQTARGDITTVLAALS